MTKAREALEISLKTRRNELKIRKQQGLPIDQGHIDRIKVENKALELAKSRLNEV